MYVREGSSDESIHFNVFQLAILMSKPFLPSCETLMSPGTLSTSRIFRHREDSLVERAKKWPEHSTDDIVSSKFSNSPPRPFSLSIGASFIVHRYTNEVS